MTDHTPDSPTMLEHRLTLYTHKDAPDITAGQGQAHGSNRPGIGPSGRHFPTGATLKCFECHTTAMSNRGPLVLDEATMIPNVGCERCHGPGGAHVEAARRGAKDAELAMPFGLEPRSADDEIRMCGSCHRLPETVGRALIRPEQPLTRPLPAGWTDAVGLLPEKPGNLVLYELPRPTCQDVDRPRRRTRPDACPATGGPRRPPAKSPRNWLRRLSHATSGRDPRHDDGRPLDPFPSRDRCPDYVPLNSLCQLRARIDQGLNRSGVSGPAVSRPRAAHPLERRLHGRVAGEVVPLLGVLAQVEQLFADVPFSADISPVALGQGGQRPARLVEQLRGIPGRMTEVGPLRKAPARKPRRSADAVAVTRSRTGPANSPAKGEPALKPRASTIVAARSRRLTVSVTTRGDGPPAGGMITRGTWSCVW